jgi:hypothetical protein
MRAETRCWTAMWSAGFEAHCLVGSLRAPDAWLLDAGEFVEAARAIASSST